MMSIRALGNLGASGADAKQAQCPMDRKNRTWLPDVTGLQAAHYYSERSADYYVRGPAPWDVQLSEMNSGIERDL